MRSCDRCRAGFYQDATGQAACLPCVPGKYQDERNSSACKLCPANHFTENSTSHKCRLCPSGRSAQQGSVECSTCGTGTVSVAAAYPDMFTCTACAPGSVAQAGDKQCAQCAPGLYQARPGQATCDACRAGRWSSSIGSSQLTTCTNCSPGRYSSAEGASDQSACNACAPGKSNNVTGANSSDVCTDCPHGRSSLSGMRSCDRCRAGFYQDATGQAACLPCVPGKYQDERNSSACKLCPANHFTENSTSHKCRLCPSGRSAQQGSVECSTCGTGTVSVAAAYPDMFTCTACAPGSVAQAGDKQCAQCAPGLYQARPGQATCDACRAGRWSSSIGSSQLTTCTNCSPGRYSSAEGASDQSACNACAPGKSNNVTGANSSDVCTDCSHGRSSLSGMRSCDRCRAGFYQDATGQAACLPCVPGKYQDERNSSACKLCAANHFANETEMTKCHVCAIGTVARSPGAAACQACIAGTYGASCSKCPPGRYRTGDDSDVTQCRECPAGFNQPENGTTYCLGCEAGQFADSSALPSCKRCPAGKVVLEKRTTDVADCQPCEITGTVPNDAQSECFQPVVNGLAGVPEERQRWTEGGTYVYNVRLNFQPPAPVTVVVEIIAAPAAAAPAPASSKDTNLARPSPPPASAAGCTVLADAAADLIFTADNWNQDQSIRIAVDDDNAFLAKDSVSFTCLIAHHVASADGTVTFASATLTLDAVSTGCGAGEFVGAADRGENGTNCVCSTTFYLPPTSDCVKCPSPQAACDENGLLAPHTSPGFWRADPTSPDLDLHPFYACPQKLACTGGNSTETRCLEGHDTSSPLCAVCNDGFYLSGVRPMERCVVCPARENTSSVSPELAIFVTVGFVVFMLGSAWYVSEPAISKGDKPVIHERLRRLSCKMASAGTSTIAETKIFLRRLA